MYLDEKLKAEEEKDYLQRIEKQLEGYTIENFYEKQYRFGTLIVIANIESSPKEIFELYKSRNQIEQTFDTFKNLLGADVSYMQDEKALETWAFINHISMMMLYKVYSLLRKHKLLSKYSAADLIEHLKYIFKLKINQQWVTSEIVSKTRILMDSLELHIT